jgi:N-methylhydantoinase B/oxoprolinase/acetone carboxylase alpha subunit
MDQGVTAVAPCTPAITIDRTVCLGWGILRSQDGRPPVAFHVRFSHRSQQVLKDVVELKAGGQIRVFSGGGGGSGEPCRRDPRP